MDSLKSIVVVAILLGVLYGIYQVINEDDSPVSPQAANLLLEFDDNDANSTSMKPEPNKDENGSDLNGNGINNRKSSGSMTGSTDSPPPSNFVPVQTELANSGKRSANSKNNFEPKSPGIQTKPSPSGIPPEGKSMTTHRGIYRP
ncbi:MAG: hypothetical protein VX438_17835, partial [Planctomycetota bacterium]|nr:hypothetical protein [Planctomycetota bacterium]